MISQTTALNFAAETALEFGQKNIAAEFRRELSNIAPDDAENKIKLAEILIFDGANEEAFSILDSIITDRNAFRLQRWQARKILREAGAKIEFPALAFDALSNYYNGIFAEKTGANDSAFQFFTSAQIAEKDAPNDAKQHLIKLYALSGKPFAALKLAANDNPAKSDELLKLLSESAEKTGDFEKAIEYEKAQIKRRKPRKNRCFAKTRGRKKSPRNRFYG